MKIVYFTRYSRLGPSSRLRSYQYVPLLEGLGVNVVVYPLFNDTYLKQLYTGERISKWNVFKCYIRRIYQILRYVSRKKVLIIEKELFPYFPATIEWVLHKLKIRFIVDIDDAVFHYYDALKNPLLRFFLSSKVDKVFKYASLVLAGNHYLEARVLKNTQRGQVKIFPTVIDVHRYQETTKKRSVHNEIPVIGWIGSPYTVKYFEPIIPVLDKLSQAKDFRLHVVGSHKKFNTNSLQVKYFDWSEEKEIGLIQQFDIGIMPLQQSDFEKGKCGYKLIQYFGCAKPVVASPIGVNTEIVDHGENGYLATDDEEWVKYLSTLLDDEGKRNQMGIHGMDKVSQHYNLSISAHELYGYIQEVIK